MIYLQKIITHWTKNSRGIPAAHLRNRAPEQFPVNPSDLKMGIVLQEIVFQEYKNFKPPKIHPAKVINETQLREQNLSFVETEDTIQIGLWTNPFKMKKVGDLPLHKWGQIKTNRREHALYSGNIHYHKTVFHIFFGAYQLLEVRMNTSKGEWSKDFQSLLL